MYCTGPGQGRLGTCTTIAPEKGRGGQVYTAPKDGHYKNLEEIHRRGNEGAPLRRAGARKRKYVHASWSGQRRAASSRSTARTPSAQL